MSRFTLSCSLVIAFSTLAGSADARRFAQPPQQFAGQAYVLDTPVANDAPDSRSARPLDRAAVRAALAKARARNFAAFRAYQRKGMFPSNTYKAGKLHVWIDEDGNLCAAATIIQMSGQGDLVRQVADQNNFIRLADVQQGPLMDWILMSGFTQDEIAAIQEPFMPVTEEPSIAPIEPILVDDTLREAEDKRLRAKYRAVTRQLVKDQRKSLDAATDRLMQHPALAWRLIAAA